MKFEVKTQNDDLWNSSFSFLLIFALLSLIVILSNVSIKLGTISRYHEINYLCPPRISLRKKKKPHNCEAR